MNEKQMISFLVDIKLSILANANCVLYVGNTDETVCESIDYVLSELGLSDVEIDNHYTINKKGV